jgi:hypothetical protein
MRQELLPKLSLVGIVKKRDFSTTTGTQRLLVWWRAFIV